MTRHGLTPEERFWAKVAHRPDGCRLWVGGINKGGQGVFRVGSRTVTARKFAWTLKHPGDVPAGMVVSVSCGREQCLEHLILRTRRESSKAGWQAQKETLAAQADTQLAAEAAEQDAARKAAGISGEVTVRRVAPSKPGGVIPPRRQAKRSGSDGSDNRKPHERLEVLVDPADLDIYGFGFYEDLHDGVID